MHINGLYAKRCVSISIGRDAYYLCRLKVLKIYLGYINIFPVKKIFHFCFIPIQEDFSL